MARSLLAQNCFLLGMAGYGGAYAQDDVDAQRLNHMVEVTQAQEIRVLQSCGTRLGSVSYPALFPSFDATAAWPVQTVALAVTGWTGGCENGKRNGHGVLNTRKDETSSDTSERKTIIVKSEGGYVGGLRMGLWCVLDYQALSNDEKDEWGDVFKEIGCRMIIGQMSGNLAIEQTSPYYRRLDDGRWQQMDDKNAPVLPEIYLPVGSVEAESARIIADAKAGNSGVIFRPLTLQSNVLDGLIAGTTIGEGQPVPITSIKGKRVALVLSTNTVAELERFSRQRQALIDATAQLAGESLAQRNRFIDATRQEVLLQGIATSLRRWTGEVTAVDDLTGLSSGKYDYAFVVDWRSLSRLDLLGEFKTYPDLVVVESGNAASSIVAGQALGGFLLTPDLKVVWRKAGTGVVENKIGSCVETRKEHACDLAYLKLLADFYQSHWLDRGGEALQ